MAARCDAIPTPPPALFNRALLLLARAGAHVTFAGPSKLRRLLASSGAAIAWRDETDLSGDFDAILPISSLPRVFGTRLETVPAPIPYLRAETLAQALDGPALKVGLCWRGDLDLRVDPRRSIPPAAPAVLGGVKNVDFYSLQKDAPPGELPPPLRCRVLNLGVELDAGPDAFVETAALMTRLDLIVTCDTSIAHLAGAFGRPVWLALRHMPEWRWMIVRADTPWYYIRPCGCSVAPKATIGAACLPTSPPN